jgi:NifU-like protein involved in Fe-S cluster formation
VAAHQVPENELSAGRGLYTPEILASAMDLTGYPWDGTHSLKGIARSRSCGSVIEISLAIDPDGNVSAVGLKPHACAIGQAAASIFAKSVQGLDREALLKARKAVAQWLSADGEVPDWPGIGLLEPARGYPARHGAILLSWDAALDALGD